MNNFATPNGDTVDNLIAMISHDLRSPITAIKGFSELALRQPDVPPRIRDYLAATVSQANRLASLIDDLTLLSQVRHRSGIRPAQARLSTILQATIERLKRLAPPVNVVLKDEAPDVTAYCDPFLTERAVGLLIDSARQFCVSSREIVVSAEQVGDEALVTVQGTGSPDPGTPSASGQVAGSGRRPADDVSPGGLGLYICRQLIDSEQGRVCIDQTPDGRTRFAIVLPGHSRRDQPSRGGDSQQWS